MRERPRDTGAFCFGLDPSRFAAAIAEKETEVAIACINGPANVVISGEFSAVDAVLSRLSLVGIQSRRVIVSHAFHSPLMDPVLDDFEREWPNILASDEATIKHIDEIWDKLGLGKFIVSPSLKYRKQLYAGGAVAK